MSVEEFDICFHVGVSDNNARSYFRHRQYFEQIGIKVFLVSFNPGHRDLWLSMGLTEKDFYILKPQAKGTVDATSIVNQYYALGFGNFNDLFRSEIFFWDYDENKCFDIAVRYLATIFGQSFPRIRYFLTYEGDELDHNVFRTFCRYAKGEMIYFGFSNLKNRIFFHQNEERFWYPPFSEHDMQQPEDNIRWVKEYIEEYTQRKKFLWGDPDAWDVLKWNWKYPLILLRRAVNVVSPETNGLVRPNHTLYRSIRRIFTRFTRRILLKLGYTKDLTPYKNRYYYFPLHMVNDSQITQRALPFVSQASLIETISYHLPHPYVLVVKDHPCGRGLMPHRDIQRIKRLSNVVYVDPSFNSHDLMKNAQAIVTINSSVGYEALMYGKPVITFGKSFYRGRGLTLDVHSMYDLGSVFAKAKDHKVDHDRFIRFLASLKEKTYELDLIQQMDSSNEQMDQSFAAAIEDWLFKNKKLLIKNEFVH